MENKMAVSWFFVLCLFIPTVLSKKLATSDGRMPECAAKYYRAHKKVPPRTYKYFHEALSQANKDNSTVVPLSWRIVGGKQIPITDVPYQVMYGKYCGGTLIAPEWVITSAHCKFEETHIYAGSSFRSQTIPYKICAHFVHPGWDGSDKPHFFDYDYQLILLKDPIPITQSTRPIAIGSEKDIKPGTQVSVSGWGHLRSDTNKMSNNLRRVFVPIIPRATCRSISNYNYRTITERMFCAGLKEGKKDSCQGDSGGPAVVNAKLVGLVSFGIGCALKNHPGVYANIPMARNWIREVTKLPL